MSKFFEKLFSLLKSVFKWIFSNIKNLLIVVLIIFLLVVSCDTYITKKELAKTKIELVEANDSTFIYKNKVGTRLKDLIGKSRKYINSRVQEMIYEAIVDDIYVTDIDNLEIDYVNDKVFVTFDVINIYKNYNEQITI